MAEVSNTLMADAADGILTLPQHHKIVTVSTNRCREDQLLEAIHCNTEVLEKLMSQLPRNTPDSSSFSQCCRCPRPSSGSFPTCWTSGQPGHFRHDCPMGNERWPVAAAKPVDAPPNSSRHVTSTAIQQAVFVKGQVNGVPALLLVDTGSAVTLVH